VIRFAKRFLLITPAIVAWNVAGAQEIVLRGVSAFPESTLYSSKFETFVKKVNEVGKGTVRINYLGGAPKVMAPFEVGKSLRDGVVDIINNTGAYYTNVLPEGDALKLLEISMADLRKSGGWEYVNRLHLDKMRAVYLARVFNYETYHIYLNKEVRKPDFTGLKLRVTPVYRALVQKLGGTAISSTPPEVYTLMERNSVDGYGWPTRGIFDFSLEKVTKYRIEPGFYNVDVQILVNSQVWQQKLNDAQREILKSAAMEIELSESDKGLNIAEKKRQADAGIKEIRFSREDEQRYLAAAREAAWEAVISASPEHGPKLKQFFTSGK